MNTNETRQISLTGEEYERMMKALEADRKRREYRDEYNQRPEVKAKRAAYMKRRNAEIREMARLYREHMAGTRVDLTTGEKHGVVGA